MPDYTITMPDGGKYKIGGPEGFTEQQAYETLTQKIKSESAGTAQRASLYGGILEGLPVVGPAVKGAGQAAAAGLRSITSGKPYSEELETVRRISGGVERDYPGTRTAGELGGAVAGTTVLGAAVPSMFGIGAPTLARGIGEAALGGGGLGAAEGIARGRDPFRSAAIGTGAGAAGPLIGALASRVAQPIAAAARGFFSPQQEAIRRLAGSMASQSPGLTGAQFGAAQRAGFPVANIELGGAATRAMARSAANISPEARQTLNDFVGQRFEQQSTRMGDFIGQLHNFDAQAAEEALSQVSRGVNSQNYQRAFAAGSEGLWSSQLERLAGSDAVGGAMKRAASAYRDEAIVSGHGAMRPQVLFTPDGRMVMPRGPKGVPVYPDLKYWDQVRRELSDAAFRAGRGTEEARRLGSFASTLNKELDRLVPEYKQAREGASMFFGASDALQAGKKATTSKMGNPQLQAAFNKMSPLEKKLFQDGYISQFLENIKKVPDRANLTNRLFNSPAQRERLRLIVGDKKANSIEAMSHVENVMDAARKAVQGNSTTAQQLADMFGGGHALITVMRAMTHPVALLKSAMTYTLKSGAKVGEQAVANEIARLLVSSDPREITRGMTLLANNQRYMSGLRNTARLLGGATALTTGQQIPQVTVPRRPEPTYGGPQE